MKVMAINGSPRKKWNIAMLLEHALEGAASKGAETELIHLTPDYTAGFPAPGVADFLRMLD